MRLFAGLILLYELFVGGWWKLGTPAAGFNEGWVGAGAGAVIAETAERAIGEGTYGWYAAMLEGVVIPYAGFWSYVAVAVQLVVGLSLLAGFWSRPAALAGLLYFFAVFHLGTIRTSPLFAVPLLFVFITNAGYYYGLDGWLARRTGERWVALGRFQQRVAVLQPVSRRHFPLLAAGSIVLGLYYLFSISGHEEERMALVGLEISVLLGLCGGGLLLAHAGADRIGVAADLVRVFVGYRFLHEVFVRTEPGINGLPGWASGPELAGVFREISAGHFGVVSAGIDGAVLPAAGAWALAFAVVQTVTGVALLVGWRTRAAGLASAGLVGLLVVLGFVQLPPLIFGSLILALALGGRYASVDSLTGRSPVPLRLPRRLSPVLLLAAVPAALAALVLGIEPGEYEESLAAVASAMVAGFCGLLGLVGLAQRGLAEIGEREGREVTEEAPACSRA